MRATPSRRARTSRPYPVVQMPTRSPYSSMTRARISKSPGSVTSIASMAASFARNFFCNERRPLSRRAPMASTWQLSAAIAAITSAISLLSRINNPLCDVPSKLLFFLSRLAARPLVLVARPILVTLRSEFGIDASHPRLPLFIRIRPSTAPTAFDAQPPQSSSQKPSEQPRSRSFTLDTDASVPS
jgi:hypothetical protein